MADLIAGGVGAVVFVVALYGAQLPLWLSAVLGAVAYASLKLVAAPSSGVRLETLARRWQGTEEGAALVVILRLLQSLPGAPERVYVERACALYTRGARPEGAAREALLQLLRRLEVQLNRQRAGALHDEDRTRACELTALRQTLLELEPQGRWEIKQ